MIINVDEIKHIYVSAQYQDMRKQINGLSVLVSNCFDMDVLDHSLFHAHRSKCSIMITAAFGLSPGSLRKDVFM